MESPTTTKPAASLVRTAISRFYLVGFMGAGKSTVGRILADKLGWPFYDVDRVIEGEQRTSVSSLFAAQGEQAFRKLEYDAILRLRQAEQAVVSLGGGAVETAAVRELLACDPCGLVIFLQAPLTLLMERCLAQDGGAGRPVLQQPELLQARYDLRLTYYRNAHLTVETETLSPENVAAAIVERVAAQHDANHSPIPDEFREPLD